jgi:uncharacterized protein (TIGR01777 family)
VRVVISGATGLIGRAVGASLEQEGVEVTRLVRRPPMSPTEVRWDPHGRAGGLGPQVLSGADAVLHLSGAGVASRRWTDARKQELRDSRIGSTTSLIEAITAVPEPPPVLLAGSAIGWYGDTGTHTVDESAPAGAGFLATLVRDWEAATAPAAAAGIRVVNLRSGLVMSGHGGMLGPLLPLFRLGLGARIGSGGQYMSWIALADEVRAIRFLLGSAELSGPVNLTAPEPVTNAEFTVALATALRRPALLAVPAPLVRAGLGEVSSELLGSIRATPVRLLEAGFTFTYPAIGSALSAELTQQRPPRPGYPRVG